MSKSNEPDSTIAPDAPFVRVPRARLEAIVSNRSLPLRERFDALLLLRSWGNRSDFACYIGHEWDGSGKARLIPMSQVDVAAELGVSPKRINEIVRLWRKQGLLKPRGENPRLLMPAEFSAEGAGQ